MLMTIIGIWVFQVKMSLIDLEEGVPCWYSSIYRRRIELLQMLFHYYSRRFLYDRSDRCLFLIDVLIDRVEMEIFRALEARRDDA